MARAARTTWRTSTELVAEARRVGDLGPVYVFGYSNGGFMSHHMACKGLPGLRAVASLAGTSYVEDSSCEGAPPVSVLHVHGTDDDVILFEGDESDKDPDGDGKRAFYLGATGDGVALGPAGRLRVARRHRAVRQPRPSTSGCRAPRRERSAWRRAAPRGSPSSSGKASAAATDPPTATPSSTRCSTGCCHTSEGRASRRERCYARIHSSQVTTSEWGVRSAVGSAAALPEAHHPDHRPRLVGAEHGGQPRNPGQAAGGPVHAQPLGDRGEGHVLHGAARGGVILARDLVVLFHRRCRRRPSRARSGRGPACRRPSGVSAPGSGSLPRRRPTARRPPRSSCASGCPWGSRRSASARSCGGWEPRSPAANSRSSVSRDTGSAVNSFTLRLRKMAS